ncbi:MAG: YdhR family protein [Bacteroidota bacterium]
MTKKILTTKFNYRMPTGELKKIMPVAAHGFAEIPGCTWKIWLINEEHKEAGGVYLFESDMALDQFLNSHLLTSVTSNPDFSNFRADTFDVEEQPSLITRGPLVKMQP